MKIPFDKRQIVLLALSLVALIGFVLPAVHLHVTIPGPDNSRSASFGALSLFEQSDSLFGETNSSDSSSKPSLTSMLKEQFGGTSPDGLADVSMRITTAAIAYFITLLLLALTVILTFIGKLNRTVNLLPAAAFALFLYAGIAILTVPGAALRLFSDMIDQALGSYASILNVSALINIDITLGIGYWMTAAMLGIGLLFNIIGWIKQSAANI